MFNTILAWLGSLLGGPFAKAAVDAYRAKLEVEGSVDKLAAELQEKELEIEVREAELRTQLRLATIGKWYEPDHLLGFIAVIYIGKVVVWDKVFMLGSTDPILGDVGVWFGWIVSFWLGKRGIENVAKIIKRG